MAQKLGWNLGSLKINSDETRTFEHRIRTLEKKFFQASQAVHREKLTETSLVGRRPKHQQLTQRGVNHVHLSLYFDWSKHQAQILKLAF